MLITTSIIGTLSVAAVPSYFSAQGRGCQSEAQSTVSQAMSVMQAYEDEYRESPSGWKDLDKISTIMTTSGPASTADFSAIELPGCGYKLEAENKGSTHTFKATQLAAFNEPLPGENPINSEKNKFNVIGCINTATGASQMLLGNGTKQAETSNLNCS